MKFYVATKWENAPRARDVMYELVGMGHEITHDWTQYPQEDTRAAVEDLEGVKAADAIIVIAEKDFAYLGTLVEIGCALGLGKNVYVLGDAYVTTSLFFRHPLVLKIGSLYDIAS